MSLFVKYLNKARFRRARRQAGDDGMVCAYRDSEGVPRYFVMPKGTPDPDVRRTVFALVHGRDMTPGEELLDAAITGELINEAERILREYIEQGRQQRAHQAELAEKIRGMNASD